jgi:hypothetical protein
MRTVAERGLTVMKIFLWRKKNPPHNGEGFNYFCDVLY